jgi:hypothetical protein
VDSVASLFTVLAAIALGLSAGALLAEGAVLVPFWRSLPPLSFLEWYRQHGPLLLRFFGPLEVIAALFAIGAAAISWVDDAAGSDLLAVCAVLAILVLVAFPLYFRRVNESFTTGSIGVDRVSAGLNEWSRWHWLRTIVATGAFVAAVAAAG